MTKYPKKGINNHKITKKVEISRSVNSSSFSETHQIHETDLY